MRATASGEGASLADESLLTGSSARLSESQVQQFINDGYVVARGLIPADIIESCCDAMWKQIGINPEDRSTWPDQPIIVPHEANPTMTPCRTPAVVAVMEQLCGPNFRRSGGASPVL